MKIKNRLDSLFPPANAKLRRSARQAAVAAIICFGLALPAAAQSPRINTPKTRSLGPLSTKVYGPLLPVLEGVRTRALSPDQGMARLENDPHLRAFRSEDGRLVLRLDVVVTARATAYIARTGARIVHSSPRWNTLIVEASVAEAAALAALPEVRMMQLAQPPIPRSRRGPSAGERAGLVTSEADEFMFVQDARMSYDVDGTGQIVGVVSDSLDCTGSVGTGTLTGTFPNATMSGLIPQGSGDIPASFTVVADGRTSVGTCRMDMDGNLVVRDEGTAMLELVHDLAPGADLAFGSSGPDQTFMADSILKLSGNALSTVIVDDIFFCEEPTFQDGPIAQAITDVVNDGVPYFTAAGNDADNGMMGNYADVNVAVDDNTTSPTPPNGNDFHNWGIATPTPSFLPLTLGPGSQACLILQWNEPWSSFGLGLGSEVDLDLHVYAAPNTTNPPALSSVGVQGLEGLPIGDAIEVISIAELSGVASVPVFVAIDHCSGRKTDLLMRFVMIVSRGNVTVPSGGLGGPTILAHSMSAEGIAVGAIFYDDVRIARDNGDIDGFEEIFATPPEPFTSKGGIGANGLPILFDTSGNPVPGGVERRPAPSITAIDGVNTTFFLPPDDPEPDGNPNFFGTSAAAPHAAAVAALMLERSQNRLSPAQVENIMRKTAFEISEDPADIGEDDRTGAGMVNALHAVWLAGADMNDDENASEANFTKLVFELKEPIDPAAVDIFVSYGTSDPRKAGIDFGGDNPPNLVGNPGSDGGNLRIWTKSGDEVRNPKSVKEGGDFVVSNVVTPAELGITPSNRTIDLWIEGVRTDMAPGTDTITFSVVKKGTFDIVCVDRVRVTVQEDMP